MMAEAAPVGHKIRQPRIAAVVSLRSSITSLALLSIVFLIFGTWIMITMQTGLGSEGSLIALLAGSLVLIFTFVFFITPIMMGHMLAPGKLVIRYGILFRTEISIGDIAEAEAIGSLPAGGWSLLFGVPLGVAYSLIDHRFTVLRSKSGLLRIRLAEEINIRNWLIPRRVIEIIFDTLDADRVLDAVRRYGEGGEIG